MPPLPLPQMTSLFICLTLIVYLLNIRFCWDKYTWFIYMQNVMNLFAKRE